MSRNMSVIEPSVQRWDPNYAVYVFQIIITLTIVIGNGTLLLFIVKSKFKVMKPNLFILSLTISDFLTGLLITPMGQYVSHYDSSQLYCDTYLGIAQFFARISSITIMVISIDRYMKLSCPIMYKTRWSSTKRRIAVILLIWLFSAMVTTIKFADSITNSGNYIKGCFYRESYTLFEQIELIVTMVGTNVTALVFYIKILVLVRYPARPVVGMVKQYKTERNNSTTKSGSIETKTDVSSNEGAMVPSIQSSVVPSNTLRRHRGSYTPIEVKVKCHSSRPSIILGLIVVLNLIFVSAPPLIYSIFIICEECANESVMHIIPWIFWMSCAVNPPIFALLNNDYRSYILSFIPCCSSRN